MPYKHWIVFAHKSLGLLTPTHPQFRTKSPSPIVLFWKYFSIHPNHKGIGILEYEGLHVCANYSVQDLGVAGRQLLQKLCCSSGECITPYMHYILSTWPVFSRNISYLILSYMNGIGDTYVFLTSNSDNSIDKLLSRVFVRACVFVCVFIYWIYLQF